MNKLPRRWKFLLSLGFILFTILGTLSHELAHWLTGRIFGLQTELHYSFVTYINGCDEETFHPLFTLAGPLQTILFGTLGYFMLKRRIKQKRKWNLLNWFYLFLGLFWLRQLFIFFSALAHRLIQGDTYLSLSDEFKLAAFYELPTWSIAFCLALVACYFCYRIVFVFLPAKYRPSLLIAAVIGCPMGFIGWMYFAGPSLLP
jgi:hypothetical protein